MNKLKKVIVNNIIYSDLFLIVRNKLNWKFNSIYILTDNRPGFEKYTIKKSFHSKLFGYDICFYVWSDENNIKYTEWFANNKSTELKWFSSDIGYDFTNKLKNVPENYIAFKNIN